MVWFSKEWNKDFEQLAVCLVPQDMKIPQEKQEHIYCLQNNRLKRYDEKLKVKEQGTLYYIPSVKYEIECTDVVTELEQYPAGLQAEVCLDVQIVFPDSDSDSGFGEWLSKHNISQLSKDDFKKKLMVENDIGFPQYLRRVIQEEARSNSIQLILKNEIDSINNDVWGGQALSAKWLKVTEVCRIQLTPLLTEEEKIAREYQKRESEKNRETGEKINDIGRAKEEALAKAQAENEIQAVENQGKIAAAKADAEIELTQEEVEHQKKMDALAQEGARLENQKKEEEKKLAEAQTDAAKKASEKKLENLAKENELLQLKIEAAKKESEAQLKLLGTQNERVRTQIEAEREEWKLLLAQVLEQNQDFAEILKKIFIRDQKKAEEEAKAKTQAQIEDIMKQAESCFNNNKFSEAVELCKKAAELGSAEAMCKLGNRYSEGLGVPKDAAQAVAWYQKAAQLGNARAMCNLGSCYATGMVVGKDAAQAVKLFRDAAKLGNARAKCNLGSCYAKGLGVEKDIKRAKELYQEAANQGDKAARKRLEALTA